MSRRIPLDLHGEVTTASSARFKLGANQPAASRPRNLRFATKLGEGFSDGGFQLARRVDADYPDLNLVDNVVFTGADGSVAYEGRNSAMPRELGDTHSIGVTLAGWMAHAKDRKFAMPFVDRDPSRWGQMPLEEQARLLGASISVGDFSFQSSQGGLVCALPNQALGAQTITEAWYQAPPGTNVAKIGYRGKTTSLPAGWLTRITGASGRAVPVDTYTPTYDDTLRVFTLLNGVRPYVYAEVYSNGTAATPAAGAGLRLSKIAVYGDHNLTLRTGDPTEPDGVFASDVIKWIANTYCPLLDTSGVQDTSYVIQHLAYNDRTYPYDAWLDINKYHLWNLAVWENKRLTFAPYDLTDYDWEIRTDDQGTTFSPQGPTTESLFNGITVTYTDPLTGAVDTLTPAAHPELLDTTPGNPWNAWGIPKWDEITLSAPTLAAQALELGRAALADRNRPKTPGTITVRGYIRDRAGNQQPVWKVRAGDTIAITNFPNDQPRLIVETSYDDEQKALSISVDRPFAMLDAYLDRVGNALQARGLG